MYACEWLLALHFKRRDRRSSCYIAEEEKSLSHVSCGKAEEEEEVEEGLF